MLQHYIFDRRMVNPPRMRFGGVKAEGAFGAGSLILIPVTFLVTAFLIFLGTRVAAALHLPARVF
jgi:hypothetical protein